MMFIKDTVSPGQTFGNLTVGNNTQNSNEIPESGDEESNNNEECSLQDTERTDSSISRITTPPPPPREKIPRMGKKRSSQNLMIG